MLAYLRYPDDSQPTTQNYGLNMGSAALGTFDDPTPAELANLEAEREFQRTGRGYSGQQATRPQTASAG